MPPRGKAVKGPRRKQNVKVQRKKVIKKAFISAEDRNVIMGCGDRGAAKNVVNEQLVKDLEDLVGGLLKAPEKTIMVIRGFVDDHRLERHGAAPAWGGPA